MSYELAIFHVYLNLIYVNQYVSYNWNLFDFYLLYLICLQSIWGGLDQEQI